MVLFTQIFIQGYKKFEEEVKRKFSEVRAYIDDRENQLLSFVKYRTDEDRKSLNFYAQVTY